MANPYYDQVLRLYKTLYFMGREYPKGASWFHSRLRKVFVRNRTIDDANEISKLVGRGEHVIKELEALYSLRTMRSRYYAEEAEKVSSHA